VEQYKLTAVQNENSYRLAMLDLSQLLELPTPEGFDIVQPGETSSSWLPLARRYLPYRLAQKASILGAHIVSKAASSASKWHGPVICLRYQLS
jgi:hypothetical protein